MFINPSEVSPSCLSYNNIATILNEVKIQIVKPEVSLIFSKSTSILSTWLPANLLAVTLTSGGRIEPIFSQDKGYQYVTTDLLF